MAAIVNFDIVREFVDENDSFIYDHYFSHFYLIKLYEQVISGEEKLIDAFNIAGDNESKIICLCGNGGIFIYGDYFDDEMIALLFERISYKQYTNFEFIGNKAIILALFNNYKIQFEIEKDRIIYEAESVKPLTKPHTGRTVNSTFNKFKELVQLSYNYSLEEWGEREGRGIDYVEMLIRQTIEQKVLIQYDIKDRIACIAQVLNLENNLPIIGSLYTPPDLRNKGYATCLVHALTKKLLTTGYDKCGIISDATHPETNHIFKQVGYQPVYEHILIYTPAFSKDTTLQ